jgi:4-hydroxy-4-methyl-2-oxoglutarate aldolase
VPDEQGGKAPLVRHLDIDARERNRRFARLYGGLVFDKLWSLGIRDTMLSPRFRPLLPDMLLAGHALTVKMHVHPESEETIRARGERGWGGGPRQREIMEAITPGCVICVDTGPNFLCAHWGEMSAHLARSLGAAGLLMAGNVRDTRILMQMCDFPVFTMGVTANAKTGWIVEEVNQPIYLPGHLRHSAIVRPGDYIFGDSDGVQVIPGDQADEVLLRCEELLDAEGGQRREIDEGLSIEEVYRRFGNL